MFIVTFRLQGKPKSSVEIIQTLHGISDRVKKIEGCEDAHVYKDTQNENIYFLVEEWQKQRCLEEHAKSDLFGALLGTRGLLIESPEIKFWTKI